MKRLEKTVAVEVPQVFINAVYVGVSLTGILISWNACNFRYSTLYLLFKLANILTPSSRLYYRSLSINQGLAQVEALSDNGSLKGMLKSFPRADSKLCTTCGSVRYINCSWCQGSKKSLQHTFANGEGVLSWANSTMLTFNAFSIWLVMFICFSDPRKNVLKCTVCNENGLMVSRWSDKDEQANGYLEMPGLRMSNGGLNQ